MKKLREHPLAFIAYMLAIAVALASIRYGYHHHWFEWAEAVASG